MYVASIGIGEVMAQEKPNRLLEWIAAMRVQAPVLREHLAKWFRQVHEEPRIIWETSAVRYSVYLLAGLILLSGVKCASNLIGTPPEKIVPMAKTADYHVLCTDESCGHHFVINRKFGFSSFPVQCPKCKKLTGMEAAKCNSPKCHGRWSVNEKVDGHMRCARCGQLLE